MNKPTCDATNVTSTPDGEPDVTFDCTLPAGHDPLERPHLSSYGIEWR